MLPASTKCEREGHATNAWLPSCLEKASRQPHTLTHRNEPHTAIRNHTPLGREERNAALAARQEEGHCTKCEKAITQPRHDTPASRHAELRGREMAAAAATGQLVLQSLRYFHAAEAEPLRGDR